MVMCVYLWLTPCKLPTKTQASKEVFRRSDVVVASSTRPLTGVLRPATLGSPFLSYFLGLDSESICLVVEPTPFKKYARQNGNLPRVGVKIQDIWNHHLGIFFLLRYN